MLRVLMAAFAALAASACTIGLSSAVDAAPFASRMVTAPFADGHYCPLKADESGAPVVRTRDIDGEDKCVTFAWDASQRLFTTRDRKGKSGEFRLADFGDGLFLVQFPIDPDHAYDKPYAFTLMAGAAHGDAVAFLLLPSDERIVALAARHPGVILSIYQTSGPLLSVPADGVEAEPIANPDAFYISAGQPDDIRKFANDLALAMLDEIARKAAEENIPRSHLLPTLLRDTPDRPNHAPTPDQQRDLDELADKLMALYPRTR